MSAREEHRIRHLHLSFHHHLYPTHLSITSTIPRLHRTNNPNIHTIITPINRNPTPIIKITTPTRLNLIIRIQIIESIFNLLSRHTSLIRFIVFTFEIRSAAFVADEAADGTAEEDVQGGVEGVVGGVGIGGVFCVEVVV